MADVAYSDNIADDEQAPEEGLSLLELIDLPNIAAVLPDDALNSISQQAKRGYEADVQSNIEWNAKIEVAIKLASQVAEEKTYPWPRASNIKYPLITTAAIQFAANAYPAIVDSRGVVKGKVIGKMTPEKQDRADRVGRHMTWQLMEEMEEWEGDTDSLLHILPITGCAYRKSYFDPVRKRLCSELISPEKLVKNYYTELRSCPRYTEEQTYYPFEITERVRLDIWRDIEFGQAPSEVGDESAPHVFLEHYCRYDLDGDGYPEPYIVTLHKETWEIVRIVAQFDRSSISLNDGGEVTRISPIEYHTEYLFMPSPDGGKRGWGFGLLMGPMNEAINSTLNMMMDAGHLQNTGGGFIGGGMEIASGPIRLKPGEYKRLKIPGGQIRENIVPLNFSGPSPVLFNLLGLLIDAAQDISSVKDVLTGDVDRNQPVGTTLALIERGMKVFSAIYKRIHRSLKAEFKILYRLNGIYLNPQEYFTVLDEEKAIAQQDYLAGDADVVPVSDPTIVTDMQRLGRAELLIQMKDDPAMNGLEIRKRYLEAAGIDDIDSLFNESPPEDPAKMIKVAELELDRIDLNLRAMKTMAEIAKMETESIKNLADAEATEAGNQLGDYRAQLGEIKDLIEIRNMMNEDRGNAGVAGPPDNPQGAGIPQG